MNYKKTQELLQIALQLQGTLEKKGTKGLHTWKKRFFYFIKTQATISILYSNKEGDELPIGEINLKDVIEITFKEKSKQFTLVHKQRHFQLQANSKEEAELWVNNIQFLHNYTQKHMNKLQKSVVSNRTSDSPINSKNGDNNNSSSNLNEYNGQQKDECKKVSMETLQAYQRMSPFRKTYTGGLNSSTSFISIVNNNKKQRDKLSMSMGADQFSQILLNSKVIKSASNSKVKSGNLDIHAQEVNVKNFQSEEEEEENDDEDDEEFEDKDEDELTDYTDQDYIMSLENKCESYMSELLNEKQRTIKQMEKKIKQLKKELKTSKQEKEEMGQQMQNCKKQLQEEKQKNMKLVLQNRKYSEDVHYTRLQSDQLEQLVDVNEKQQQDLDHKYAKEIESKDYKLKILLENLHEEEKLNENLTKEIHKLKEDLEYANSEASQAKLSYAQIQAELDEEGQRANFLEKQNQQLFNHLDEQKQQKQQYEQEIQALTSKRSKMKKFLGI